MYQTLTMQEIRAWLKSIRRGERTWRPGLTFSVLARELKIPMESLRCYMNFDTAKMSAARQRALSKFIALYQNGMVEIIEGRRPHVRKQVRYLDKPKPRLDYQVSFGKGGPALKAAPRPRLPNGKMPSMKDLMGG